MIINDGQAVCHTAWRNEMLRFLSKQVRKNKVFLPVTVRTSPHAITILNKATV